VTDSPRAEREALDSFFVTAARGTELILKDELRELGMRKVRADRGGVRFLGTMDDAFFVCLWSRLAMRVLFAVGEHDAKDQQALYEGAREIPWERALDPKRTLAVTAVSKDEALRHTGFVAMKVKDAIVDRLRDQFGARPDVDRDDADVGIFVHVKKGRASFYLDVSGRSLHERGWRRLIGDAPLKETLAAAMLRLSGWDRESPLLDPMCGAGTIAIEADHLARGVAPGLGRKRFGLERWADHDATRASAFATMRDEARARARPTGPTIFASDLDPRAVDAAKGNADAAAASIVVSRAAASAAPIPGERTCIVVNPPYGLRIEGAEPAIEELITLGRRARPATLAILKEGPAKLPFVPVAAYDLSNGALPVTLSVFDIPR
jgi:23S rRNA (guanine2445-N2)-methyltransferase / 23S rRNA (guanine2069-N7)-methyltransferase